MGYFSKLAFKNLFRHKLRTSVSIAAIAISVIVVVFTRGLIVGMIDSIFSNQIQYQSGHIRIINQEYEQKERLLSLNYTVDGFNGQGISPMINKLENLEGVKNAIPRIKFGSLVSADEDLIKMIGWGVDPATEIKFTDIEDKIVAGRMVQKNNREIVMGSGLLDKLSKTVGDRVTILYNTSFNSFKGTTFKIVGRIKSDLKLLNDSVYFLPLGQAQKILYLDSQVTDLLVETDNMNQVNNIASRIKEVFSNQGGLDKYSIIPWNQSGGMVYMMQIAEKIYNVIYIFLVILASFVVINTMVMIVRERTQEIGMMSALGLNSREILKLFVMEGTFMGVIGSFIGALLGGLLTNYLSKVGINYTEAFESVGEEVLMNPILYPVFSINNMIFGFILGIIVVTVACIIPARRAAKLEPNDALREI